ncbi:hypothetical protein AA313_de0205803 [Arthrobotrys entomopaga]|nr:hypothetical protein AA313_de0205803 [Arthrobotrys entomopaga]
MSTIIDNKCADTKLTGIAAILNPLGQSDILEFHTTAFRNLGMITEDISKLAKKPYKLKKYESAPAQGAGWELGPLLPGTPLVVLKYNNQIRVYAISKYSDDGGNLILSVSPSTSAVGISTKVDAFTGTGDGEGQAWLYELQDEALGRTVNEYPVEEDGSVVGTVRPVTLDGIGNGSRISAFYHNAEDMRYIVYQAGDKTLKWKPISSASGQSSLTSTTFGSTTNPSNNTLRTWTTHAGCAIGNTAFIFYAGSQSMTVGDVTEQQNKLFLLKTAIGPNAGGTPDNLNVDLVPNGALSVVPIINDKKGTWDIIVFYMAKGDGAARLLANYRYPTGIKA